MMITCTTAEHTLEAGGHPFTVRTYAAPEPAGPVLVWMHGGAFVFGDLEMPEADATSRALAQRGVSVVSVDYTLASTDVVAVLPPPPPMDGMPSPDELTAALRSDRPRAPYPVASLQAAEAFRWAVAHATELGGRPDAVAIGGASAGGNLAGGLALRLRDSGSAQPVAAVLIYPVLHAELPPQRAELLAAIADLDPALDFPPEITAALNANYLGGAAAEERYAFPGGHDLTGLAPTLIVNSHRDRLRASGEAYAAELAGAGVDVEVVREPGALHGFLSDVTDPARERTVERISRFLLERAR